MSEHFLKNLYKNPLKFPFFSWLKTLKVISCFEHFPLPKAPISLNFYRLNIILIPFSESFLPHSIYRDLGQPWRILMLLIIFLFSLFSFCPLFNEFMLTWNYGTNEMPSAFSNDKSFAGAAEKLSQFFYDNIFLLWFYVWKWYKFPGRFLVWFTFAM